MANSKKKAVTQPVKKPATAPSKKPALKAKSSVKPNKPAKKTLSKTATAAKSAPAKSPPQPSAPTTRPPTKKAATAKPSPTAAKKAQSSRSGSPAKAVQRTLPTKAATRAKASAAKPVGKPSPKVSKAPASKAPPPVKKTAASVPAAKVAKPTPPAPIAKTPIAKPVRRTSGSGGTAATSAKPSVAKAALRTPPARPISFTLDEVRAIAKSNEAKTDTAKTSLKSSVKKTVTAASSTAKVTPPAKPNHIKAASLADILGFNPNSKGPDATGPVPREVALVPEKFKRYYKLLVELRVHLTGQIDQHSEDTLKRSSKDDAGDLSSYGQHMADAGTDTFDRDFALSLVSSEQEALSEIEAAIKRITDGSYGVCEVTGQPIAKARLLAVPFTRYSAEAQKEIERNHYRVRTQAGLFGELGGEDSGKIMDADGD